MMAQGAAAAGCCCAGAPASARQPLNDEMFCSCMLTGMQDYERAMGPYKSALFSDEHVVGDTVVEVGIGAGVNLPYYLHGAAGARRVIGVDPNASMREHAARTAAEVGGAGASFEAVSGRAERLPFDDGSVDCVISTLVMCSVNDVPATIREVGRVLRPGGRWIFIEHTLADAADYGALLPTLQRACDPLQRGFFGCTLLGDPGRLILESGDRFGFRGVALERFHLQRIPDAPMGGETVPAGEFLMHREVSEDDRAMRFHPGLPHFLLSPHLAGILVK